MDMKIRQGETLQIPIEADDVSAVSVLFQAAQDGVIYLEEMENFTITEDENGVQKAVATIFIEDTNLPTGEYEYMLTIAYEDGVIDKLPDTTDCGDDCGLPLLIICEGDFTGVS